ncbi:uncharacterized protein LOC144708667 [Wolffia australiana]
MKQKSNYTIPRSHTLKVTQADGANWIFIMGGALLSTLSIRLGWKLKQIFDAKRSNKTENVKSVAKRQSETFHIPSNSYYYAHSEDSSYLFNPGSMSEGRIDLKQMPTSPTLKDGDPELSLVVVMADESAKDGGSPEQLEPPRRQFHHSNMSDSPCVSEAGSMDMFTKREVVHRLRQQLKRRDEMILDMQTQITDLHKALAAQSAQSAHLQAQLDCATRDLLNSERELHQLRKPAPAENPSVNGHANGYVVPDLTHGRELQRIEMLKREVDELKEVIQGKEFLLQNYKEQKVELSSKVKELQLRLSSHVPNIL